MKNKAGFLSPLLVFTFFFILNSPNKAVAESRFRLMAGAGITQTDYDFPLMDKTGYHYGMQFLSSVSNSNAYGIEIDRHRFFNTSQGAREYISTGIVLEEKNKIWLRQIGTVGYIGSGDNKSNPFGLRVSIGIEFPWTHRVTFTALLRNDIVFEEKSIFSTRFEVGIGSHF